MDKQKQIEEMAEIALKNTLSYTCAKQIAMNFYNAGYSKIPENAVVLTREEYARHKGFSREEVEEISETATKNTRKETAEKFAEYTKRKAELDYLADYRDLSEPPYLEKPDFLRIIDEVCKELAEGK